MQVALRHGPSHVERRRQGLLRRREDNLQFLRTIRASRASGRKRPGRRIPTPNLHRPDRKTGLNSLKSLRPNERTSQYHQGANNCSHGQGFYHNHPHRVKPYAREFARRLVRGEGQAGPRHHAAEGFAGLSSGRPFKVPRLRLQNAYAVWLSPALQCSAAPKKGSLSPFCH